jgi:hypothetical protein
VSSYLSFDVGTVKRQVGSTSIDALPTKHGGDGQGGARPDPRTFWWFRKKTLMAVIDCMLLNAYKLWNMSVDRVTGRKKLRRFDFMLAVADALLHYKTEPLVSPVTSPAANQPNRSQASEQAPACTGTNVVESNGQRMGVHSVHLGRPFVQEFRRRYAEYFKRGATPPKSTRKWQRHIGV